MGEILKYDEALRATVRFRHQEAAYRAVPLPDPAGAFPATRLPWVYPLVCDAHTLGRDLARRGRAGRTILVTGAVTGVLRLFCPDHVAREMVEYMDVWAELADRPVDEIADLWLREYLPVLRVVHVPRGGLVYPDEAARVRILATPGGPHSDPDDVPTAILALLLDAPLFSEDVNLLRAVYGIDYDTVSHGDWLGTLRAGGDLGPLGESINAAQLLSTTVVGGTCGLVAKSAEVFGWPATVAVAGLGALAFHLLASDDTKAKVLRGVRSTVSNTWAMFQAVVYNYAAARAEFESMAPDSRPFREGYESEEAVLRRVCIHSVARARSGHLSAKELSEGLSLLEIPHGEKRVRQILREEPAFDQVYQGRFQLGRALTRRVTPIEFRTG